MDEKFDSDVTKLEQEIFDISKNINKFKNKNHKTMLNMMEKIKSFSNEYKSKNDPSNQNKKITYNNKKKSLIKAYNSLSNYNITPTNPNNKIYQFENLKKPIILKENNLYQNLGNETETIILYSNKNPPKTQKEKDNEKKNEKYISNFSYNKSLYENIKNNNSGRNTCKAHITNCFSFNFDDLKKNYDDNENINENDIKKRTYSLNNIQLNNVFKNDLTNDGLNNDLKCDKKNRNRFSKNKQIKKVKSYNNKGIPKKLIKNIQFLSSNQNTSSREIKSIKREHCNINISEYYKNINKKEYFPKKKNGKIKIINHKKLKNYPSNDKNNLKLENEKSNNGYHRPNTSRNYVHHKIYNITYNNNKGKNNNTINGKEYDNCVCSTFNPYFNKKIENESSYGEEGYQSSCKVMNSFRENIPLKKNLLLIKDNKKNNLIQYQYLNDSIKRNNESSYSYLSNRNKSTNIFDINEDIIIKKHKINNNKYNKDFIDIITNKNNDNCKYDFESIYNNNINQKKENKENKSNINNKKYINIEEEKYKVLLSLLKCKNIDECLNKIDVLVGNDVFVNKINFLYDKYNSNNSYKEKNLQNIFSWIELNVEQNKKNKDELKKYQNFCGKLMNEFSGNGFDKFKNDIMKTVNKNKSYQENSLNSVNSNMNNGINYQMNNKENYNFNTQFYNNNDYGAFKNKTHSSYSNISFTNNKNGEEIAFNNINN